MERDNNNRVLFDHNEYWYRAPKDVMAQGRKIKSDLTLLKIVEEIEEADGVGVSELAESVGIAKSTAHAHLAALEDQGYVKRSDQEYFLGLRFLRHGITARNREKYFKHARSAVNKLAQETGEKVWCITEEHGKAIYLYGAFGSNSVQTWAGEGEIMNIHSLASGKVILAFMEDERREQILEQDELSQYTDQTISSRDALDEELAEIRKQGFGYNFEESVPGLNAISAPVFGDKNKVLCAISVSGPAGRLTKEVMDTEVSDKLLATTNEIEMNTRFS